MNLRPKRIPCHSVSPMLFSARAETRRETVWYFLNFEKTVWWNPTQISKFTVSCYEVLMQQHNKLPTETDLDCSMTKEPFRKKKKTNKTKRKKNNREGETETAEKLITIRKLSLLPTIQPTMYIGSTDIRPSCCFIIIIIPFRITLLGFFLPCYSLNLSASVIPEFTFGFTSALSELL